VAATSSARVCGCEVVYPPGLAMRRLAAMKAGNAKTEARDAYGVGTCFRSARRTALSAAGRCDQHVLVRVPSVRASRAPEHGPLPVTGHRQSSLTAPIIGQTASRRRPFLLAADVPPILFGAEERRDDPRVRGAELEVRDLIGGHEYHRGAFVAFHVVRAGRCRGGSRTLRGAAATAGADHRTARQIGATGDGCAHHRRPLPDQRRHPRQLAAGRHRRGAARRAPGRRSHRRWAAPARHPRHRRRDGPAAHVGRGAHRRRLRSANRTCCAGRSTPCSTLASGDN
jgi:hypothetical protein